jgi:isocitrate dehydrogenase kinase/phosphatase
MSAAPRELAQTVLRAYEYYVQEFNGITRRAPGRFETRDWTGSLKDGLARLRLYKLHIDRVGRLCSEAFGPALHAPQLWEDAKATFRAGLAGRYDADLALMFIDSVMRRALSPDTVVPYDTGGVDPKLDPDIQRGLYRPYTRDARLPLSQLIEPLLVDCRFESPYRDVAEDARYCALAIEEGLRASPGAAITSIEMLRPLFYRNKGAYLVGRMWAGSRVIPLALALSHPAEGITVDAVLTEEGDLRRIFSYTRANFHVELEGQYRELLGFLHSIMPHKNWAALYSSIGFMNPAKIQLSKDLGAHLKRPRTKLTAAWGIPGLVMVVFTSHGFPYVFKVIRDDDQVTKTGYIGHQGVTDKYRLVQEGDRVGRLLDTITFHHLRFSRDDFEPKILRELLDTAGSSVRSIGGDIAITRCYAQREATPLPIYLRQCDWPEIERVLNDLGWCLKDMAAAGLFPGELDLKNFGVAEDGRVVFFDFDGLDELGKFSFDDVSLEASLGQEELFEYLLHTYRQSLIDVFRRLHPDLFTPPYWQTVQRLLRQGEVLDTFPYPAQKRLEHRRQAGRTQAPVPGAIEAALDRLGLRSAHRKGLLTWRVLAAGMAAGRAAASDLTAAQRLALRKAFEVEGTGFEPASVDVIVIDGRPAFVCLPESAAVVIDLSAHYGLAREVADDWRDRVRRDVLGGAPVAFRPEPAASEQARSAAL